MAPVRNPNFVALGLRVWSGDFNGKYLLKILSTKSLSAKHNQVYTNHSLRRHIPDR